MERSGTCDVCGAFFILFPVILIFLSFSEKYVTYSTIGIYPIC